MVIKELQYYDRPYEKLEKSGAYSLTNSELLAIILKNGTKEKSSLDLAKELMAKDKENIGFEFLSQYSIYELMKIKGIGRVKAIELMALVEIIKRSNFKTPTPNETIRTPEQLSMIFMGELRDKRQEILKTALLDNKNRITKVITNSIGTTNSNSIEIREVLSEPIKCQAPKICIAHNHPSGDVDPSKEDIDFTIALNKACKIFGIEVLDHIIIGNGKFYSFKRNSYL